MCVLELSKCVMYEHHYKNVLPRYGEKAKLMMTDTDSLLYHIITDDVYRDMEKDKHLFDFSNYPIDHFLHDISNAKKPGLFKDETAGIPKQQFAGLRSKMYNFKCRGKEQKRAKGIIKSVVKKETRHSQHVDCLLEQENILRNQFLIRSHLHQLQIQNVNKVALCSFDDKRYVMDNGLDTLAFGHFRINERK
ncbi:unnamed protein product [Mytilus coruscus]|uniref:DNA-directed DNA polymerase n=1 Tax=Mytilus coruscus TaxID=42192 RepID=A0A6J8B2I6_MYTCO|nr:unnamed protein product [Mytilus coruscus]